MPSSAAQPAEYLQGDCAVQPVRFPHSLRSLHPTSCARLDFYNIGWIYGSKKRRNSRERLVGEVMNIVKGTSADAIGLSEVFNVLKDELYDTRQEIMAELLQALNGSTEQPVWDGRADVHYIFLWNTSSLQLRDYEVVSCGINDHPWRKAQYIQFTTASDGEPLHIYHNHSPSNTKGGKHLTLARRKSILVNLWDHVRRRSNAEQPAVVFGGDYNCTPVEWALCFTALKSHLRSVQVCTSKSIPCHKGDRAVAINVFALQEESFFGKSYQGQQAFTDAHDVVLVPLTWGGAAQPATSAATAPMPARSPPATAEADTAEATNTSSSAAQPASSAAATPMPARSPPKTAKADTAEAPNASSSAAQPASSAVIAEPVEAPSLAIPTASTPLYNALLEKLAGTGDENILEDLAFLTLFGALMTKAPFGSAEQPHLYRLSLRIESLLTATNKQRQKHIDRLLQRQDPRASRGESLVFSDDDQKEALAAWRNEPQDWMKPENLAKLSSMTQQKRHQACRSKFSVFLFEFFGSRSLTETFLKFPVCSAEQPACILQEFVRAWKEYQHSPTHHEALQDSQPNRGPRISKQIYQLQQRKARGQWVADWVAAETGVCRRANNWHLLSPADQCLCREYQSGHIERQIVELRSQQRPRFEGALSCMMGTSASSSNAGA